MAPLMAASVACSAVVFMFLLVCHVFSYIPAISFTRDESLYIRLYTSPDISPVFDYSDVLLDIVVGGAAACSWSSDSADFEQRCLAFIWQISALNPTKRTNSSCSRTNKDFSNSAALCFTKTGNSANSSILDNISQLALATAIFLTIRRNMISNTTLFVTTPLFVFI